MHLINAIDDVMLEITLFFFQIGIRQFENYQCIESQSKRTYVMEEFY